jgi:hypothetical protein
MDYYRLSTLAQSSDGCEGRHHIQPILDAAYPRVHDNSHNKFEQYEHREKEEKMFFSQRRLVHHFERPDVIRRLHNCPCGDCSNARNGDNDMLLVSDIERSSDPLLLALMVYLGKLHYLHFWRRWRISWRTEQPNDEHLAMLLSLPLERIIFRRIYNRAVRMLNPVMLEGPEPEICPYSEHFGAERFPYLETEWDVEQGSFGKMVRLQILPEYLRPTMEQSMRKYACSNDMVSREVSLHPLQPHT